MAVHAHLEAAATQRPLPDRYAHAEKARPKVVDLAADHLRPRQVTAAVTALVEEALQTINTARIANESDRAALSAMLLDFEWVTK